MNTTTVTTLRQALAQLQSERTQLDAAITNLRDLIAERGRVGDGAMRRNGRAGGGLSAVPAVPGRRKPSWSPAARKAAAARMQKYWAQRRKEKAGAGKES